MSSAPQVLHRPVSSSAAGTSLVARADGGAAAAAASVAPRDGDVAATSAWARDERERPGRRLVGVALGALGMLLGVLVGLAALAATAVDLAVWTLKSS